MPYSDDLVERGAKTAYQSTRAVSVPNRRTNRQLPDWPSLGNNLSFAIATPTAFGTIYGTLPIVPRCCELCRCCVRFASDWSANREDLRAAHDLLTQAFNAVVRLPPAPLSRPSCDLAGVLRLARVPIKLLLEIGLGVDRSTERTHWDFEFPAAQCADCDDRGRAKPLDNSKTALFRRVVLLNHRT